MTLMRIACGVDLVYIPKIKTIIQNAENLEKLFDPKELSNKSEEHLAGIIAAKEAFFKAIGQVPRFRDIQVDYEKKGKPHLIVSPTLHTFQTADVSITHETDYAAAFVVLLYEI